MYVKFVKRSKQLKIRCGTDFVPVPDRFSIPLHLKEAATRACLQMRVVWLNMTFHKKSF